MIAFVKDKNFSVVRDRKVVINHFIIVWAAVKSEVQEWTVSAYWSWVDNLIDLYLALSIEGLVCAAAADPLFINSWCFCSTAMHLQHPDYEKLFDWRIEGMRHLKTFCVFICV